jgi:large subunit ribosomal protein L31
MKADIHPAYKMIKVKCSCGHEFETGSSLAEENLNIEVCSNCHPFYTGKQKIIDTAGRVDSFNRKFSGLGQKKAEPVKPAEVKAAAKPKTTAKPAAKPSQVKKEKKDTTPE